MHRNCIKIFESKHKKTILYIDEKNASEILTYLFKDNTIIDEFKFIKTILAENQRNKDRYCKVKGVSTGKVFEMRFTKNNRNDRIYCIEQSSSKTRNIILVELFEGKKSNDIPNKIINKLKTTLSKYYYVI